MGDNGDREEIWNAIAREKEKREKGRPQRLRQLWNEIKAKLKKEEA